MNRFRVVEATLNAELAKPYAYGNPAKSDCLFMGFAMVDALTGSDLCGKYAGSYKTLIGAQKRLRKHGHKSLVTAFAEELDQQPQGGAEARFGDIAILRLDDGAEHVAICLGTRFVTKTPAGRQDHYLSEVIAAFHIG
ncbi:hypothetical protein HRR99_03340 [Agrobacterium vaccinii]|uniref:DUF6950 family protein n=1 Tax=Agrobacterium vaccinii TaxID=2735528 RepID=UPI001E559C4E|nr:hypothetical protein [Agrobacterium vaccinii]UHS60620.1 hypothetical protein HRR99_03340 [Agrobacterium vaccinii]